MPGFPTAVKEVLKDVVRFEYQFCAEEIITPGHSRCIYSERVEAGWILTVTSCYLYIPDAKTPDYACICVEIGPNDVMIRSRGKDVGRRGMSNLNPFYVGEYQRIHACAPNAEEGDTISLCIMGYLMRLWDWRMSTGSEG